jgi:hypothetical protein
MPHTQESRSPTLMSLPLHPPSQILLFPQQPTKSVLEKLVEVGRLRVDDLSDTYDPDDLDSFLVPLEAGGFGLVVSLYGSPFETIELDDDGINWVWHIRDVGVVARSPTIGGLLTGQ